MLPLDCVLDVSRDPQKRDHVEIDIILSPRQAKAFRDRINKDGSDAHAIDEALENVKSEEASATVAADLEAIQALIRKTSGGNATINDAVKQYLRRWFVSQGGVKVAPRRKDPNYKSPAYNSRGSREQQAMPLARRQLLGPSVHHIKNTLVPAVLRAIVSIKEGVGHEYQAAFDSLQDPSKASIWHTVHAHAKAASAAKLCPRDGKMGCAYVDTLTDLDDVGRADALLSYSWGYLIAEVSAALSAWTERASRDPKKSHIWICSLCLNQHRMDLGNAAAPADLAKEFGERVVAIGHILPMLEPWDDPGYVKRAW